MDCRGRSIEAVDKGLGRFDPQATYDAASVDYENASRDYWQHLARRTVDRIRLAPGEWVLDVPCGTGASLVAAAGRVGPTGRVVGVDCAARMLDIARDKLHAAGLANVELRQDDMTALTTPERPYDAVLCVLGLFFADDMPGLVRSLCRLLRPGGRLGVAVFGEHFGDPMREVFLAAVEAVAPGFDAVEPWRRTANEVVLHRVFEDAGLEATIETEDDTFPLPAAEDWWRIVMGSALRRTVTELGQERAAAVRARCDRYLHDEGVAAVHTRSRYAIVTSPDR